MPRAHSSPTATARRGAPRPRPRGDCVTGTAPPITDTAPQWIDAVSKIFPVRHLVDAFLGAFYGPPNFAFSWTDVLVVAAWGVLGLALAIRFFSWEPRR